VNFLVVNKLNILSQLLDGHKDVHVKVLGEGSLRHYANNLHPQLFVTYPFCLAVVAGFWEKGDFGQKVVILYDSNRRERAVEECDVFVSRVEERAWVVVWSKGKVKILSLFC
jgi:hypothetical protein